MLFRPRPLFDDDPDPGGSEDSTPAPEASKQPAGDPKTAKTEDWEAKYHGLQRVVAKKDKEIENLTGKVDQLITDQEELKLTSATYEKDKSALETQAKTIQDQLAALTADRDTLKKQLTQQGIIIEKFPQLAHLSKYIPPAETDELFLANAQAFADDLGKAVGAGVKDALSGATPATGRGKDKFPTEDEEDALYRKVTALAGRPGKEEEYEKARSEWMTLQATKSKTA